jgi:hypothetical protein
MDVDYGVVLVHEVSNVVIQKLEFLMKSCLLKTASNDIWRSFFHIHDIISLNTLIF